MIRKWMCLAVGLCTSPVLSWSKSSVQTFAYSSAGSNEESFDFYSVPGQSKAPLLVFLHGGAWIGGDKSQYQELAQSFVRNGIAVAITNYRLAPQAQDPAFVEDLEEMLRFLARKKSAMPFDPQRVFLMGHSAGAHIIAQFAARAQRGGPLEPAGLIGLEGIYDLPALDKRWPLYHDWFLKKAFGTRGRWKVASPTLQKIMHKTPWLVVHSQADELVDTDQSRNFVSHLRDSKVDAKTFWPKGLDHFGVIAALSDSTHALHARVLSFLRSSMAARNNAHL